MENSGTLFNGGLGGGVNVASAIGAEEIGHEVVDGKIPTVVAIYGRLSAQVELALAEFERLNPHITIIRTGITHAEVAAAAAVSAAGRMVAAVTTRWALCGPGGQNCAAAFRYIARFRGVGHCVYPRFPIAP